jgi:predicted metal-dependent phosphoesterase TrpH
MMLSKAEVVAQLRVKLEQAQAVDAANLARHQQALGAVASERRAFLKVASEHARKRGKEADRELAEFDLAWPDPASCPLAAVPAVEEMIRMVELISTPTFATARHSDLMNVLRRHYGPTKRVC